jgi:hypothetical protein
VSLTEVKRQPWLMGLERLQDPHLDAVRKRSRTGWLGAGVHEASADYLDRASRLSAKGIVTSAATGRALCHAGTSRG